MSLLIAMLVFASCGDDGAAGEPPTPTTITTSTAATSVTTADTTAAGSTTLGNGATTSAPSEWYVTHPDGASFVIPEGWDVAGPAIATEFSANAECLSVEIVDQALVEGGPGPSIYRAIAQVCSQPDDGSGVEGFMERTYGEGLGGFEQSELADRAAYRLDDGNQTIYFVAGDAVIFQIVTVVETDPELEGVRREQIGQILDSLTIDG